MLLPKRVDENDGTFLEFQRRVNEFCVVLLSRSLSFVLSPTLSFSLPTSTRKHFAPRCGDYITVARDCTQKFTRGMTAVSPRRTSYPSHRLSRDCHVTRRIAHQPPATTAIPAEVDRNRRRRQANTRRTFGVATSKRDGDRSRGGAATCLSARLPRFPGLPAPASTVNTTMTHDTTWCACAVFLLHGTERSALATGSRRPGVCANADHPVRHGGPTTCEHPTKRIRLYPVSHAGRK